MPHLELIVLFLLLAVIAITGLAQVLRVPYPILLVIGGSALGFMPGVPNVEMDPDLVLLIFLPPLLFNLGYFASLRDLRANTRVIAISAFPTVLLTAALMAGALKLAVPSMPWAVAFAFGAIASPTDPLAAISIAERFGVPRRVVTVIEGESLINDGTALVIYRTAVAAALGGSFALDHAIGEFVLNVAGGAAVGAVVALLLFPVFGRITDDTLGVTTSVAAGYLAYLPAEQLGVSGVIATVVVGLWLGHRSERVTTATARLQGYAFWDVLVFILNATLFVLVGLQLPGVLETQDRPASELIGLAVLVGVTVIVVRIVLANIAVVVIRTLDRRPSQRARRTDWRQRFIVQWSGFRGAVSLAAALALPTDFPERDLILFLTLAVIFATLVVQGLTLPLVIKALGIHDDGKAQAEAHLARVAANNVAVEHLRAIRDGETDRWTEAAQRLLTRYEMRQYRLSLQGEVLDAVAEQTPEAAALVGRFERHQHLIREVLDAQRAELARMRAEGEVGSAAMRAIEREFDLEDARIED